jgi:hypothetical protein
MNASWVTVDTSAWLWTVHLGTSAKRADLIPPPKSAKEIVAVQVRLVKALRNVRFGSKADMCSAQAHVRFTPESDIKCDLVECPLLGQQRTFHTEPWSDICGRRKVPERVV